MFPAMSSLAVAGYLAADIACSRANSPTGQVVGGIFQFVSFPCAVSSFFARDAPDAGMVCLHRLRVESQAHVGAAFATAFDERFDYVRVARNT